MTVRIAVIVAALAAMAVGGDPAAAQDRMALVVGIDNYAKLTALQKAGNDARAVSSALAKLAFRVDLALDVGRRGFNKALSDFLNKVQTGRDRLFPFLGSRRLHRQRHVSASRRHGIAEPERPRVRQARGDTAVRADRQLQGRAGERARPRHRCLPRQPVRCARRAQHRDDPRPCAPARPQGHADHVLGRGRPGRARHAGTQRSRADLGLYAIAAAGSSPSPASRWWTWLATCAARWRRSPGPSATTSGRPITTS